LRTVKLSSGRVGWAVYEVGNGKRKGKLVARGFVSKDLPHGRYIAMLKAQEKADL
jgi:hypothetical protein